MILLGSLSAQGIHKVACKHNWSFLVYALANVGNTMLVGIPGFLGFFV